MKGSYNAGGVVKATVAVGTVVGATGRRGRNSSNGRLLVIESAPDAGTIRSGVGTKLGMMSVVAGPAPTTAVRKFGKASLNGSQYYVTSGTKYKVIDGLPYTSNGDLLVDTT